MTALFVTPLWSVAAVPPPPVPHWFTDARVNIAKVKAIMDGDWVAQAAPLSRSTELRVGTFGDSAPSFLLMERTAFGPGPYPFHRLSVLFYSTDCHAYEMLSIDKLSEPGPVAIRDCTGSFPIELHPDGSLSFQYTDWNHERVIASVNKERWQETRYTPGITERSEVQFVRSSKTATWGGVQ